MAEPPDYVRDNRLHWDLQAHHWVEMGRRAWTQEPRWGIWGIPEIDLQLLPSTMEDMSAIELGCGTGYVSAWMTRLGARCVAIDNSAEQLKTARGLAAEHELDIEFIHGNAETIPYPDESFDFAISEYGVAIWADPFKWVPETARVLRSGGELSFLGHHPMVMLTQNRDGDDEVTRTLLYPYFDLHRVDWREGDDRGTEFNLPISQWFRLFEESGLEVLAFHEIRSPSPTEEARFGIGAAWAFEYPSEQAWRLRKR